MRRKMKGYTKRNQQIIIMETTTTTTNLTGENSGKNEK